MIPVKDSAPTRTFPFVTVGLIVLNAYVFLIQAGSSPSSEVLFFYRLGVIPRAFLAQTDRDAHETAMNEAAFVFLRNTPGALSVARRITEIRRVEWLALFTSMFVHGGFLHLLGNMWFLWIFGNNVEDRLGRARFLGFYLLCGLVAHAAHIAINNQSVVPTVGASGAISGILGAYVLLFPHARILTFVPVFYFMWFTELPAYIFLGYWIILQSVMALASIGVRTATGVAWFAHVGGFAAGALIIYLFCRPRADDTLTRTYDHGDERDLDDDLGW